MVEMTYRTLTTESLVSLRLAFEVDALLGDGVDVEFCADRISTIDTILKERPDAGKEHRNHYN
jgi:hypothetical protein